MCLAQELIIALKSWAKNVIIRDRFDVDGETADISCQFIVSVGQKGSRHCAVMSPDFEIGPRFLQSLLSSGSDSSLESDSDLCQIFEVADFDQTCVGDFCDY